MGFSITAVLNIALKLNSGGPPPAGSSISISNSIRLLVVVIPRPKPGGLCFNAIDYRLQHRLFFSISPILKHTMLGYPLVSAAQGSDPYLSIAHFNCRSKSEITI